MREENSARLGKWALAAAILTIAATILMGTMNAPGKEPDQGGPPLPPAAQSAADTGGRVQTGCEIVQTMGFSRCGHSVTRRVSAPGGVVGADFAGARAYYSLWQLQAFSPERIVMNREIDLFCPMHWVLSVNEAGEIVRTHNVYGDGMAVDETYDAQIGDFSEEDQLKLLSGLGFDTVEEAEAWLSAH